MKTKFNYTGQLNKISQNCVHMPIMECLLTCLLHKLLDKCKIYTIIIIKF